MKDIAEAGHVLSVKAGGFDIFKNKGRILPRSVGIVSASTFSGFCAVHDDAMFKPVETGQPSLTARNVFLLAFRALSYELYEKKGSLAAAKIRRKLDYGADFESQAAIQQHLATFTAGTQRGLDDAMGWKATYDTAFVEEDWSAFSFYAVEFDQVLPVAACGAFHPEFDLNGVPLQILSRGKAEFDHVTVSLTTLGGNTVFALGWIGSEGGPAHRFVSSYADLPDDDKADMAMHLVFEHVENSYIRPSWYEALSEDARNFLISRFNSGIGPGNRRTASSLRDRGPTLTQARVQAIFSQGVVSADSGPSSDGRGE